TVCRKLQVRALCFSIQWSDSSDSPIHGSRDARHISAAGAPYLQQNFTAFQCVGDSGLDLVERIDCRNRYSHFVGRDHLRCRSDGLWELLCKSRVADREAPNAQIFEDHVEGTDRQWRKAWSRIGHECATLPQEPGEPPGRSSRYVSRSKCAVGGLTLTIESCRGSASSGRTIRSVAGTTRRCRHTKRPIGSTTRSPTLRSTTFSPISSTRPTPSLPMTEGNSGRSA